MRSTQSDLTLWILTLKPGGSMLMCGKSGVGRRSAVSIVSALHQAKWINLKMGKKYYEFFLSFVD